MSSDPLLRPADSPAPSILSKAFDILGTFTPEVRVLTLTDIAKRSRLPKSTVHRLLPRLIELGVLETHADRGYRLGIRLLRLAATMPLSSLRESSLPFMVRLQAATGRQVQLAAIRAGRMILVERVIGTGDPVPNTYPGQDFPAWATASGKVILSRLPPEEVESLLAERIPGHPPPNLPALAEEIQAARRDGLATTWHWDEDPPRFCMAAPVIVMRRPVAAMCIILDSEDQRRPALDAALRRTAIEAGRRSEDIVSDGREDWFPGPQ